MRLAATSSMKNGAPKFRHWLPALTMGLACASSAPSLGAVPGSDGEGEIQDVSVLENTVRAAPR
jgi:hypothetical protein